MCGIADSVRLRDQGSEKNIVWTGRSIRYTEGVSFFGLTRISQCLRGNKNQSFNFGNRDSP